MVRSLLIIIQLLLLFTSLTYTIASCKKNNELALHNVAFTVPIGFPEPVARFIENPLSAEGIELGRKLFYDGRLSIDGEHPCSSCHQQVGSFGTYEHDRSHGVFESHTLRNAPALINLAWNKSFHWDGAYHSLEDESAQPITGHIEMGETFNSVIRKLEADPDYQYRFRKVFHIEKILPIHIQKALAQFTGSIIAADSRYDRYKKGLISFTAQEETGYFIFKANCASCHPEPLFTDFSFRNIGMPVDNNLNDFGRIMITGKKEDSLKFKVPTLRNVYVSSNYMHDGRFNTLAQCINHYRTGVQASSTLDPLLNGGISMTNTDATALALFLRSLTDSSILRNSKFSKPVD